MNSITTHVDLLVKHKPELYSLVASAEIDVGGDTFPSYDLLLHALVGVRFPAVYCLIKERR